jgi:hypothetical protein
MALDRPGRGVVLWVEVLEEIADDLYRVGFVPVPGSGLTAKILQMVESRGPIEIILLARPHPRHQAHDIVVADYYVGGIEIDVLVAERGHVDVQNGAIDPRQDSEIIGIQDLEQEISLVEEYVRLKHTE